MGDACKKVESYQERVDSAAIKEKGGLPTRKRGSSYKKPAIVRETQVPEMGLGIENRNRLTWALLGDDL